jgi:hypothetical protein
MGEKEIIEGLLKDNSQGLSIEEISSRTRFNRPKTNNLLSELKGEGKIIIRKIGQVKLHYWKFKGDE